VSILTDALRILGRFFGLRPGPDVSKLPEPQRVKYAGTPPWAEPPKDKPKEGKPS